MFTLQKTVDKTLLPTMAFNVGQAQPNDAWIHQLTSNPHRIAQFLFRNRIVFAPTCPVPLCNTLCTVSQITNAREMARNRLPYIWKCTHVDCNGQRNYLHGSYLYGTKLSMATHIYLLYKYYLGRNATETSLELNMRHQTVIAYFDYFRRNISNYMQNDFYPNFQFAIGFPIQWDEAAFAKGPMHHRGHRREPNWILGGTQTETGMLYLQFVPNKDAPTLLPIIAAVSPAGAVQITDGWRGYFGLDALGFTHWNVNHARGFVNPLTGIHTNTIEGVWSLVRGDLRKYRGLRRNALQLFLDEYAFKRKMRRTDEGVIQSTSLKYSRIR